MWYEWGNEIDEVIDGVWFGGNYGVWFGGFDDAKEILKMILWKMIFTLSKF